MTIPESGQHLVASAAELPERPAVASTTPPPASGAKPPSPTAVRWHRLSIESTSPDGDTITRRAEGDDSWVAASLRALADQLDPPPAPQPVMRPPGRGPIIRERTVPGLVALPPSSDVPRRDPMSLG